ncbi:hypothetical protein PCANC_18007 [Puccinia coronata f. sp. avenae]|uniref:DUF6589 domain-containing protein n=1 Tax=Puccinia coronata f. sp. avenae TaxID=200324 RepID=A0A2N5SJ46_9BASI|nr:hypothetical protein PCANC_18007 [Puccinia coronata f. sp. avenae]
MVSQDLPLLYGILMGVLTGGNNVAKEDNNPTSTPASKLPANIPRDPFEAQLLDCEGTAYIPAPCADNYWAHHLAATMCAMTTFLVKQWHNRMQLQNAIRFLACGVSDRVNNYLHKLGLTSCWQTALDALQNLTEQGEKELKQVILLKQATNLGPFICINNLDMEEKVHMASVGDQTSMFHGTWGYVQLPNKSLLDSLDASQLNLKTYLEAINNVPNISIDPQQFMPTQEASNHYYHVWTSQIAHVMSTYVSLPADKRGAISTAPPVIEQVSSNVPPIYMLKLMDQLDNSAKGIGQVLEALQAQTGLSPEDFSRCLQPMDGDLGTIQNFNSLCDLRHPSAFPQHGLNNIVFQLGGSHTIWNIAQVILTAHIGNPSNENDLGMWQLLEALGIPHEKVIQKKDFTLMLQHMELVHMVILFHCLRVVLETKKDPVTLEDPLGTLLTDKWNNTIIKWYERFCLPQARAKAAKEKSPKLHNLLIQLHEFSTFIKANNVTKAGDVGQLMNVWKICGHPSYFMPKDNFLETQNYWLKHFYNQGRVGTEVQRLKNLFSMNIILVDMDKKHIHQNRKVTLTLKSLQMFSQMTNGKDILDSNGTKQASNQAKINDSFKVGLSKLRAKISMKDPNLGLLRLHFPKPSEDVEDVNESNEEDGEEDGEDTDEEL